MVSRLCLGTMTYGKPTERWPWALNEEQSRPFIQKALELGINFFDTADVYSAGASEEVVGKALKDMAKRDEVVLATKVFNPMGLGPNDKGLSRKHIMSAIDASLKRLGTDYVDLYQIHRWDYHTSIEETMEALHDVVKAGKARYIGASSMYSWQFAQAQYTADLNGWTRFVSMQPHYNLLYREEEREMIPFCIDQKIAVIPWSPLARGLLTGKRSKERNETERAKTDAFGKKLYGEDADFAIVERVNKIATEKGLPNAQVALAWMLSKPAITAPIIGASKPGHLEDAVAALSVQLSNQEIKALEELYQPHPVLGFE
jgi:aryl-alcohol dehydrogenase-like predicted oxidoreductase